MFYFLEVKTSFWIKTCHTKFKYPLRNFTCNHDFVAGWYISSALLAPFQIKESQFAYITSSAVLPSWPKILKQTMTINMLTHLYSNLLVNCGARSSTEILTQTFTFCCHINDLIANFPTEIVL